MAAAAARASVTPPEDAARGGASPPLEAASALPLAPPISEPLSSHLGVIRGKIVDDGALGMIDVPHATDRSDAVNTSAPQCGDVLRHDAADGDDGDARIPHEAIERDRTGVGMLCRDAPRRAGDSRCDGLFEG